MYGSIEDLEALVPLKFTSTSSPTRAQASTIMDTHSEVLTVLMRSRGVPVPATGTPSYKYLTRLVLLRTASDILRRRANEEGEASSPIADACERQAIELTEQILTNPQAFIETRG